MLEEGPVAPGLVWTCVVVLLLAACRPAAPDAAALVDGTPIPATELAADTPVWSPSGRSQPMAVASMIRRAAAAKSTACWSPSASARSNASSTS